MKRIVVACLFASFAGGFAAVVAMQSLEQIAFSQVTVPPVPAPTVAPPRIDPSAPGELPSASRLLTPTLPGSPLQPEPGITPSGAFVTPPDDYLTDDERVHIAVYESANRSVVNVTTRAGQAENFFMGEMPSEGSGSGSVLDREGHILTNYHVVEDAREIQVTLSDGESYEAGLVGQDPLNDIAVLRIEAPPERLFPVTLGDSSRLRVGQKVLAIGNPFGLERTMTTGIVSSLDRSLPSRNGRTIKSVIQIDAALNRGNSGGPLMDNRGRLIGMNTAIASSTGENTGVGFAIPVATIRRLVPQLIRDGRIIRPYVGITQVYQTDEGLLVSQVAPGSPAERAGLQGIKVVVETKRQGPFVYEQRKFDRSQADLIVGIEGKRIETVDEFMTVVESKAPGDQVTVTVVRGGQATEIPITLGSAENGG
ncbi:MAG TPA: trypsin-like peptidase domain-containing protein [Pirellulaceae bacterium]|jgi:S1-C subfamily serine protease|nr:trypsin-like peptidase domain-containing protein [Pirellulaceae bacterium]